MAIEFKRFRLSIKKIDTLRDYVTFFIDDWRSLKLRTVLCYPGSKQKIKGCLLSLIPEHKVYLEPFFGSGSIFFDKEKAKIEVINDIDNEVYNYFKVLRDHPNEIIEKITFTPFSSLEYKKACDLNVNDDSIEKARKFAIRCYFGIGNSAVYQNGFRRSKSATSSNKAKTWNELPVQLQEASLRLKNAIIENDNALNLIERYNNKDVFIYCDPPYVLSTRKEHLYKYDMPDDQHIKLLKILNSHKGKVMISGYDNDLYNDLYNDLLSGWHKECIETSAERGKRIECIWMNYEIQQTLF